MANPKPSTQLLEYAEQHCLRLPPQVHYIETFDGRQIYTPCFQIVATNFHRFNELPAELRSSIWGYALDNEYGELGGKDRIIEVHDYDRASAVSIAVSRRYPKFFSVNREARYETAKLDGGEWMPVYLEAYSEDGELSRKKAFEVQINFSRDIVFLSERFMDVSPVVVWIRFQTSMQHFHLEWLTSLLDVPTLQKIQHILLTPQRPPEGYLLESNAWWRGEGLEIFMPGVLKGISVVVNSINFALWQQMIVGDYLHDTWVEGNNVVLPWVSAYAMLENGRNIYYPRFVKGIARPPRIPHVYSRFSLGGITRNFVGYRWENSDRSGERTAQGML